MRAMRLYAHCVNGLAYATTKIEHRERRKSRRVPKKRGGGQCCTVKKHLKPPPTFAIALIDIIAVLVWSVHPCAHVRATPCARKNGLKSLLEDFWISAGDFVRVCGSQSYFAWATNQSGCSYLRAAVVRSTNKLTCHSSLSGFPRHVNLRKLGT